MKEKSRKHIDDLFRDFLEQIEHDFEIDIEEDEPVFPIEVACKLVQLQYWTLRNILKEGIIEPKKVGKKKMLFSKHDIKKIECIKYLMEEKGVNLHGIKMFFEISGSD
ncbi:MAG: MerR family transcriptional regulator [Candidatus Omnitrophica bacterium]|nr:MerR family transcriptional regulator [Candidatus Omnitrophota bacterium]